MCGVTFPRTIRLIVGSDPAVEGCQDRRSFPSESSGRFREPFGRWVPAVRFPRFPPPKGGTGGTGTGSGEPPYGIVREPFSDFTLPAEIKSAKTFKTLAFWRWIFFFSLVNSYWVIPGLSATALRMRVAISASQSHKLGSPASSEDALPWAGARAPWAHVPSGDCGWCGSPRTSARRRRKPSRLSAAIPWTCPAPSSAGATSGSGSAWAIRSRRRRPEGSSGQQRRFWEQGVFRSARPTDS